MSLLALAISDLDGQGNSDRTSVIRRARSSSSRIEGVDAVNILVRLTIQTSRAPPAPTTESLRCFDIRESRRRNAGSTGTGSSRQ